jgi:hypothetical protein
MRRAAAVALLAAGAACIPEFGPLMAPGQDCLGCHDGGEARRWTAAGTFPGQGRTVVLTGADGRAITLETNRVGNFYTAERLAFPLRVAVDGASMPDAVTYGGCNQCHGSGGTEVGPLMAPGQDCLPCHDGTRAQRWTAAGTWGRQGATVVLQDSGGKTVTLVTNQVGNFYTAEALAFPLRASVDGQQMGPDATYGGCNRCHGGGGGGN